MNQKELFIISLTIFLTIIAWMILDIYKVETKTDVGNNENIVIIKSVNINKNLMLLLKEKQP